MRAPCPPGRGQGPAPLGGASERARKGASANASNDNNTTTTTTTTNNNNTNNNSNNNHNNNNNNDNDNYAIRKYTTNTTNTTNNDDDDDDDDNDDHDINDDNDNHDNNDNDNRSGHGRARGSHDGLPCTRAARARVLASDMLLSGMMQVRACIVPMRVKCFKLSFCNGHEQVVASFAACGYLWHGPFDTATHIIMNCKPQHRL